jgi:transcriptional regulator with XRE-family HTH domain
MTELFGERLTRLRVAKRISSRALADLVGVEHRAILRMEYGETKPRLDNLSAIARHLAVSIDYLVTGHEQAKLAALHHAIRVRTPYDRLAAMVPPRE